MKKILILFFIAITFLTASTAQAGFWDWLYSYIGNTNLGTAVRTLVPSQGGTGIASTTASNDGKYLKVSSTTPNLTYSFDTPAGGSG